MFDSAEECSPNTSTISQTPPAIDQSSCAKAASGALEGVQKVVLEQAAGMDEMDGRLHTLEVEIGAFFSKEKDMQSQIKRLNMDNSRTQRDLSFTMAASFNATARRAGMNYRHRH